MQKKRAGFRKLHWRLAAILLALSAGILFGGCRGEGWHADIDPEEVIGRVALPALNDGRKGEAGAVCPAAAPAHGRSWGSRPDFAPLPERINTQLPDFAQYKDTETKKAAFFDFLRPIVIRENREVLRERARVLLQWRRFRHGRGLGGAGMENLRSLAEKYRVSVPAELDEGFFRELLIRIDKIPVSLALIQAAKESAWGTSYFARKGNNLFGHWCFEKGCGIVPRSRPPGANHEVRSFDDVSDSVSAYLLNLNSHPAYAKLRLARYRMRLAGKKPDARLMAAGLRRYSAVGEKYVETVREMIRGNREFLGTQSRADS